ncbi:MAG TPA: TIGR04282 family arsenosugar biosynthesis glycosyltransferase [Nitrococcus sp.]|nr:TIGR04282 family arsenosugar biosynthesis glycosyltransferase [Nitrococcus sp.]
MTLQAANTGVCYPAARLLVFAKAPVAGRVKTRLISVYGRQGAALRYRQLLRHTLSTATQARAAPVELWAAPDRAHPWFAARAHEEGVALRVQVPGDLGQRMHRALQWTLRTAQFAAIIGADCAALAPWQLQLAFDWLANGADAVFGPAEDGGYVLVGLRRPQPMLFQAMPWGGSKVMAATRKRLRRSGLRWVELPLSFDIDRPADLTRLRRQAAFGTDAVAKYPSPAIAARG